jgi:hypothetical protein
MNGADPIAGNLKKNGTEHIPALPYPDINDTAARDLAKRHRSQQRLARFRPRYRGTSGPLGDRRPARFFSQTRSRSL